MKIILKILLVFMKNLPVFSRNSPLNRIKLFCLRHISRFHIGSGCIFQKGAYITGAENFCIGNNSGIGLNAAIQALDVVTLGNNVMMGPDVMLFTANHVYDQQENMVGQGHVCRPVHIDNNVWIGARTIILPGVYVAPGCIIGAGSVVTKSLNIENGIYGGNPAKYIRNRFEVK